MGVIIIVITGIVLGILFFLPNILGAIIDPRNVRIIEADCKAKGYENVRIKLWPNHYGVYYSENGKKQYAACMVKGGVVKWKSRKRQ